MPAELVEFPDEALVACDVDGAAVVESLPAPSVDGEEVDPLLGVTETGSDGLWFAVGFAGRLPGRLGVVARLLA